jgi:hypothetical protein
MAHCFRVIAWHFVPAPPIVGTGFDSPKSSSGKELSAKMNVLSACLLYAKPNKLEITARRNGGMKR